MKKLILILLLGVSVFGCQAQETEQTEKSRYFLIRHAEKVISKDRNPELRQEGKIRAIKWSKVFESISFDEIYSTDYLRTVDTAEPTADSQELKIKIYKPHNINFKEFRAETKGKTVLIVGHSNTIPSFVNGLIGQSKYQDISEKNNGNLYIVEITEKKVSDILLHIN